MFLTPRIGGPDAYGTWKCVLFDGHLPKSVGNGPTEDAAVADAVEHAERLLGVGGESLVVIPIGRMRPLLGREIKEAEFQLYGLV